MGAALPGMAGRVTDPMAREDDSQAADQLSREAEQLLAEYFRIRREYNALDRDNPSHAGRRAELKARYHELDRKYTQLVQSQDERVEARQGPTHSRADILWEGATQSPARINEPVEPELESRSADEAWIELTTPVEGPATDRMFEEALRQIGEKTPARSSSRERRGGNRKQQERGDDDRHSRRGRSAAWNRSRDE